MTSCRSSGSSLEERAVEPIRSQNMTLSGRRSAMVEMGTGLAPPVAASSGATIGVPQSPQNFAPTGAVMPQAGQATGNTIPQEVQKRLPDAVSAPQSGQFIGTASVPREAADGRRSSGPPRGWAARTARGRIEIGSSGQRATEQLPVVSVETNG